MAPCPEDAADHEMLLAYANHAGSEKLARVCEFLVRFQHVRFGNTPIGVLIQCVLEKLKRAHRTRADGWAAQRIVMQILG